MQTYSKYRPTGFDCDGLGLDDRQAWYVLPVAHNRDSGILARSNFRSALRTLGGESDNVEVHRFGHWGPGWFELILVRPDTPEYMLADQIEMGLMDYPVISETDYSDLESMEIMDYWNNMSVKGRVELCKLEKVNIFSARSDYPPDGVWDRLSSWVNEG